MISLFPDAQIKLCECGILCASGFVVLVCGWMAREGVRKDGTAPLGFLDGAGARMGTRR